MYVNISTHPELYVGARILMSSSVALMFLFIFYPILSWISRTSSKALEDIVHVKPLFGIGLR